MKLRLALLALAAACLSPAPSQADSKPMRIWNLTASAIVELRLAPAGGSAFGGNLAAEDKDGELDIDERLKLPNVAPGVYDAKIGLKDKRICTISGLKLEAGGIASIEEKDLKTCAR